MKYLVWCKRKFLFRYYHRALFPIPAMTCKNIYKIPPANLQLKFKPVWSITSNGPVERTSAWIYLQLLYGQNSVKVFPYHIKSGEKIWQNFKRSRFHNMLHFPFYTFNLIITKQMIILFNRGVLLNIRGLLKTWQRRCQSNIHFLKLLINFWHVKILF